MSTTRSRRALLLAGLAAVMTVVPGGTGLASSAPPSGDEPWILYQSCERERCVATLVHADGSDRHSPTEDVNTYHQSNPDWSPDGQRIVFIAVDNDGDETEDLWTINLDGTGAERLIDCESPCLNIDDPDWSPDGTSIVYSRNVLDGDAWLGSLEQLHLDTGTTDVLLPPADLEFSAGARYSPDGDAVVFERVYKDSPGLDAEFADVTLTVADLTASPVPTLTGLTEPGVWAELADWSPDGESIVFAQLPTPESENHDLFTIHPDGSGLARVTTFGDDGGHASHAGWSPDGTQIIFSGAPDGAVRGGLMIVNADGTDPHPAIASTYVPGDHPRMQPTS